MTDIIIKNWADLCDRVFEYRKTGHWIFRDEGAKDNKLMPRIGRPESRKRISDGKTLRYDRGQEALMIDYSTETSRKRAKIDSNASGGHTWLRLTVAI